MYSANPKRAMRNTRKKYIYHKVQRSDKRTKTQRGEGKTVLRNIMACEAKQTDKKDVCKRGRELKREAHKPEVCEAKHTHITKNVCKAGEAEERSTTQTRCLRGEAHSHEK